MPLVYSSCYYVNHAFFFECTIELQVNVVIKILILSPAFVSTYIKAKCFI